MLSRYTIDPLHKNLVAIDTLIPVPEVGNRRSDKTETLLTIMNTQRMIESGVCPIYVMIGQKSSSIASGLKDIYRSMFQ